MKISLLGPVEVRSDEGAPIDLGGARLRRLLIRLAVEPGRVVSQDALIDAVWRDEPPANAANALQQLVSRLRKAGVPVDSSSSGYALPVPPDDIDLFNGGAASQWRGPALAEVADEPWALAHIARASEQRLAAQEVSTDDVSELEALVVANPLRERPVSQLMRALAGSGRNAEALTVFERYRRRLADELGADPSRELSELHLSLLRGQAVTRLPLALTSFVGREAETGRLRELLTRSRLVTLTGPGGCGKTRLAVETARPLPRVWLVELASHGEATEVAPAILAALGLREQVLPKQVPASEPVDKIVATLAHQTGVLLLDNCEHLVAAVAGIAQHLLSTCPGVTILATSREPLGIGGETIHTVEPLALEQSLRLLHDRAAAHGLAEMELDPAAAQRLCTALDGMPLAIELAAARLRAMPLEQLVSRLDERFRLLTRGERTALPRHQTLRAVVDWSWELCTDAEREVWQRLSVFHGGADLAAVEAVCGEFDNLSGLVDKSLVRVENGRYTMLETIREYGLARLESTRETVERAHADYFLGLAEQAEPHLRGPRQVWWLKRLRADQDNLHAAVRRAVAWGDTPLALGLVAALGWYWWLSGSRAAGARLSAEALDLPVTVEVDPQRHALAYATAALNLMDSHGQVDRSVRWFDRAAEISEPIAGKHPLLRLVARIRQLVTRNTDQADLILPLYQELFADPDPWVASTARAFHAHTMVNLGMSRQEALDNFQQALRGYREAGDRWGMGLVLEALSTLEASAGDHAASAASAQEAIDLLSELGTMEDLWQLRMRLAAALWMTGDSEGAVATMRVAQAEADHLSVPARQAVVAFGWAGAARGRGDLAEAKRRFDEAERLLSDAPAAVQFRAILASHQGLLAGEENDLEASRRYHTEALRQALDSADYPVIGTVLIGCADLALREGDGELAAQLLGAATAVNGGVDHSVPDRPAITECVVKAIGSQRFAAAYARGKAASLESAAALTGLHA